MEKKFALLIISIIILTACQPTPEKEIVVNKADGGLQEKIESAAVPTAGNESLTEPTAETTTEDRWETFFQKEKVNITINAEVVTPEVKAYPVLSIVPIEMDQEWVDKAIDVFFQGAAPYEKITMTKQTIEAKILNRKKVMEQILAGNCPEGFTEEDYDRLDRSNQSLMERYEDAPDEENMELIPANTELKEKYNGQFNLKELWLIAKFNKPGFAELIITNNWTIKVNYLQFYNYTNNDLVSVGNSTEYTKSKQLNGVSITLEEAQQTADATIAQMGITGVELKAIRVANIFEVCPRYSQESVEADNQAYEFVYQKTYNGIDIYYFDSHMKILQTEEGPKSGAEAYSAVLEPEKLNIRIDDSGIILFNWKNPTYSDGIISENVELMDFEKIKEIFGNQIFYHQFYDGAEGSLDIFIDKIVLSYFIEPVIDSNNEYMAIPVWDFINEASGEYNSGRASTYLTINAIDGSVINRAHGC